MLDFGYRSRCCRAPIRLGFKKSNITSKNIRHQVWICTRCRRSNIDIIPNSEAQIQDVSRFSDNQEDYRG